MLFEYRAEAYECSAHASFILGASVPRMPIRSSSARIPVCVFAKSPVAGRVKTRLAIELGEEPAAKLAAAMFQDVWQVVLSCPQVRPVLATINHGAFPVLIPPGDVWLQGDGDLGERMDRIFLRALDAAPAAIALGADSPLLTVEHLQISLTALDANEAVLGRCHDGGFYLLALRRCPAGLFSHLPWSRSDTADAMKRRLVQHRFHVHEIAPLFDVDRPEDLDLLASALCVNSSAAPATRAWHSANRGVLRA